MVIRKMNLFVFNCERVADGDRQTENDDTIWLLETPSELVVATETSYGQFSKKQNFKPSSNDFILSCPLHYLKTHNEITCYDVTKLFRIMIILERPKKV